MANSDSKGARRLQNLIITIACIFGLVVPVYVLIDNGKHSASHGPHGMILTANETTGRPLFAKGCGSCHTLSATKSVGVVGPNLDVLKPSEALLIDAIANGRGDGNGQMPALVYTGQQATDVAAFVAAVAGK